MSQTALFAVSEPPPAATPPLVQRALEHVGRMRDRGLITEAHELHAELVVHLARSAAGQQKAYALAQIAKELREAIAGLPAEEESGPLERLTRYLGELPLMEPWAVNTPPTYATTPTAGATHDLAQVSAIAGMLGTPLMPWQQLTTRVVTERAPNGIGWRYPVVVITVPRQSGKTTLIRSILVQRAIMRRKLSAFYTAQTGKDAVTRWEDMVQAAEAHPTLEPLLSKRLRAGSQALLFPNGSSFGPFAPTKTALHGSTPHLVVVDEAFAYDDVEGVLLEGAIRPAQQTLPDRQWWIVSTAGTADSTWLRRWRDIGREAAGDPDSAVAYLEWSAPEGASMYDPATWRAFHPALGYTITEATLAEDAQNTTAGEWERAYGNRWTATSRAWFDPDAWDQLGRSDDELPDPTGRTVAIAYDVAADRSAAAVFACWVSPDGHAGVRAIATGPGINWVRGALDQARAELPSSPLVAPADGPVRQITDELERDDIEVTTVGAKDYATACGSVEWRAAGGLLLHDRSPALRAAVMVAQTRPAGDGLWAFSLRESAGSIAALRAITVGIRAAEHTAPAGPPKVWFPGEDDDDDQAGEL